MDYTKLGRTGVEVSRLCLGTMNLGACTDETESWRMMDRALDLGINFFDTANTYGAKPGDTETVIGRWLAQGGGRRQRLVLASKVYGRTADEPNRGPGLSAYKIKREVDESLRRLQTDHLDLYQMHQSDRSGVGWDELWGAFEDLVRSGKVIYIGSSNFAGWEIAHAQGKADRRGFLGLVSEQHKYNLATREPELEVLPACTALGIAVIPHSPLANGFLSGKALVTDGAVRAKSPKVQYQVERRREQLNAYSQLCRRHGLTEPAVALAWLLRNEAVTSPIIGPRTLEQLESSVDAVSLKLDEAMMGELAEIFPGPGKPAPQAYLWPPVPPKD